MMLLCIFLVFLTEICQVSTDVHKSGIFQDSGLIVTEVGNTVTLKCICKNDAVTFLSWYQQSLGGKPNIISSRMVHKNEADIYPAFKQRFQVSTHSQQGSNDLTIQDLQLSDSATYFCGVLEFNAIEFGQGVFIHVKTSLSKTQTVVWQPEVKLLQLGDSMNLSCAANIKSVCVEEQNFYWIRYGSSEPAIMYPSEGQCTSQYNEEPHGKNCTFNLEIQLVNSSDAGMYYCALASCGEVVFGNGTRVEILGSSTTESLLLVHCLSVALAVSIIVVLVLAFNIYKLVKKLCSVCRGTVSHLTSSETPGAANQDADSLHYAALNLKKKNGQRWQHVDMDTVCVYSSVKNRKQ